LPVSAYLGAAIPAFSLKIFKESVHAAILMCLNAKASNAVMHSQVESFQSPTTTLSVSLVTLMDALHNTVRTAGQMQLLLRKSVMLLGRRRTVCKQVNSKRLTR